VLRVIEEVRFGKKLEGENMEEDAESEGEEAE
jgi:hypothetical protein